MDIVTTNDTDRKRLVSRAILPAGPHGPGSVEVKSFVNERTGEYSTERSETPVEWGRDLPGFTWQSSAARLADDALWHHKLNLKKEQLAEREPDPLPASYEMELVTPEEARRRDQSTRVSFGGLGGLLGPKGALTQKEQS